MPDPIPTCLAPSQLMDPRSSAAQYVQLGRYSSIQSVASVDSVTLGMLVRE